MNFDFHIHSIYSKDSMLKPETIIKNSIKKKLSGIAITDHDTIVGAKKAESINNKEDFLVIIGAEIKTEKGDIIGLFLNEEIKSKMFYEVKDEISDQGGLMVLAHPFKNKTENIESLAKEVDLIEGLNARIKPELNLKGCILAKKFEVPIVAGSDAHIIFEIGAAKNKLPIEEFNLEQIRKVLLEGLNIPFCMESPSYIRLLSQGIGRYKRGGVLSIIESIHKNIGSGFLS